MFRICVTNKDGVEVEDRGIFNTNKDAFEYKKIHVYELEPGDSMDIKSYNPKTVSKHPFVNVYFSTFVKAADNQDDDAFIKTDKRLWCLCDVFESPNMSTDVPWAEEDQVIILQDGSEISTAYNIVFSWPKQDLLDANDYAGVDKRSNLFRLIAQKALEKFLEEKPKDKKLVIWDFMKTLGIKNE